MSSALPLSDTPPAVVAIRDAMLREQSSAERMQLIGALNRTVELLMEDGIRRRHPGISDAQLFRRMADLRLGDALAARVYGPRDDATS